MTPQPPPQGYWCSSEDGLDLKYTFRSSAALPEGCDRGSQAYFSTAMRRTLVYSLLTIGFHMLMWVQAGAEGFQGRRLWGLQGLWTASGRAGVSGR
jgi:hypothetical protein